MPYVILGSEQNHGSIRGRGDGCDGRGGSHQSASASGARAGSLLGRRRPLAVQAARSETRKALIEFIDSGDGCGEAAVPGRGSRG